MRSGLVMAVALAGCRLGFDQRVSDGSAIDDTAPMIELRVVSDAYAAEPAGKPIAGATVLADRGAGLERSLTDNTGAAQIAADGLVALHVVFNTELGWRIYTLAAPRPGIVELGGRTGPEPTRRMTFALPDNGGMGYGMLVPERCGFVPSSTTARVALDYNASCDGQAVHVIAVSSDLITSDTVYIDGGTVTLAAGTTRTIAGAARAQLARRFEVTNLPLPATSVAARLIDRAGLDLLPLAGSFGSGDAVGPSATVDTFTAPGGNTVQLIFGDPNAPIQYPSNTTAFLPVTPGARIPIDAAGLIAPFSSLVLTRAPSVSWTGAPGGTITILEAIGGGVQWDAFLDPAATSVAFPAIPDALGVPVPTAFDFANLVKLDVPGATSAGRATPRCSRRSAPPRRGSRTASGWAPRRTTSRWRAPAARARSAGAA